MFKNTRVALQLLGADLNQLRYAIATGKLKPPAKDDGGRFVWTDADVEAARRALAGVRPRRRAGADAPAAVG